MYKKKKKTRLSTLSTLTQLLNFYWWTKLLATHEITISTSPVHTFRRVSRQWNGTNLLEYRARGSGILFDAKRLFAQSSSRVAFDAIEKFRGACKRYSQEAERYIRSKFLHRGKDYT